MVGTQPCYAWGRVGTGTGTGTGAGTGTGSGTGTGTSAGTGTDAGTGAGTGTVSSIPATVSSSVVLWLEGPPLPPESTCVGDGVRPC